MCYWAEGPAEDTVSAITHFANFGYQKVPVDLKTISDLPKTMSDGPKKMRNVQNDIEWRSENIEQRSRTKKAFRNARSNVLCFHRENPKPLLFCFNKIHIAVQII